MSRLALLLVVYAAMSATAVPPPVPSKTEPVNPTAEREAEQAILRQRRLEAIRRRVPATTKPEAPRDDRMPSEPRPRTEQSPPDAARADEAPAVAPPPRADSIPLTGPNDAETSNGPNGGESGARGGNGPAKTASQRVNRGLGNLKRAMGEMRSDAGDLGASGPAGFAGASGPDAARTANERGGSTSESVITGRRALDKRPDFYSVLPPSRLKELKAARAAPGGAELRDFKHLGLSAAGDFAYDASCAVVSGDCNPHAVEQSYRRGDLVAPETLARVYNGAIAPSMDSSRAPHIAQDAAAAPDDADGEVGSLAGRIAAFFGARRAPQTAPKRALAATSGARPGASARRRRTSPTREDIQPAPESSPSFPWGRLMFASFGVGALLLARRWVSGAPGYRVVIEPLKRDDETP